MSDNIVLGERVGKSILPVRDRDNIGHPVIGFVIEDERGVFAITHRDEIEQRASVNDAVFHIAKKWRLRK